MSTKIDPCWFCNKHVTEGYCCSEFDFAAYHIECGDKISIKKCAICISEGLTNPCCIIDEV